MVQPHPPFRRSAAIASVALSDPYPPSPTPGVAPAPGPRAGPYPGPPEPPTPGPGPGDQPPSGQWGQPGHWDQPPAEPYVPGGPPGGYPGSGVQPADPGKRLVARLIDLGILVAAWTAVFVGMLAIVFSDASTSRSTVDDMNLGTDVTTFAVSLGMFVLYWLYESLMASTRGQTIGKMIMKLRITDRDGNNLTTGAAMKRSLVWLAPVIPCCVGWITFLVLQIWGMVAMFNRADRLTPMDQFAGSTVTYA